MASHHHTDDVIGLVSGTALAVLAHLVDWVSASTWAGELLQTGLFGLVGGAAGMVGRLIITRITDRKKTNENTNNNQ